MAWPQPGPRSLPRPRRSQASLDVAGLLRLSKVDFVDAAGATLCPEDAIDLRLAGVPIGVGDGGAEQRAVVRDELGQDGRDHPSTIDALIRHVATAAPRSES